MLLTKYLNPFTRDVVFGDKKDLEKKIFEININQPQLNEFQDKRVLVKGVQILIFQMKAMFK